jgi:hypothetical protein
MGHDAERQVGALAVGVRRPVTPPDGPRPSVPAGLCASCTHARIVESARQSVFLRCDLSRTDPRFPKYPRLPVLACEGYMACGETD